jgi:hypothetical protein
MRSKIILAAHFLLLGYVLIRISWIGSEISIIDNTLIFFTGAILIFSACCFLLINVRKRSAAHQTALIKSHQPSSR